MRFLLASTLLVASTTALAGGWTQPSGDFYVKAWNRTLIGQGAFLSDGTPSALGRFFQDHQLQLYGEYGLIDQLTLIGYLSPFGLSGIDNAFAVYTGPAYGGIRYQVFRGSPLALSVQASVGGRLPIGEGVLLEEQLQGERLLYRPNLSTLQADVQGQMGLSIADGWLALDLGFRGFALSEGAYLPAANGYAQFGWNFGPIVADAHMTFYWSVGTLDTTDILGVTNTRFLGLGFSLSWWMSEHVALYAGVDGVIFAASNAGAAPLNIGLEFR